MYASGLFEGQFKWASGEAALDSNVTSDVHREVAYQTIVNGAVLLKNDAAALPLSAPGKIAMIGKYCKESHDSAYGQGDVYSGGGSGYVMSHLQVTPLEGVRARFSNSEVTWGPKASAAKGADVAIVCASAHAEEGWDRANLTLPEAEALAADLKKQSPNQKVVVLAIAPGPITTEWIDIPDAALLLFMPGEQIGRAVGALLSGAASPGGRLPISLPHRNEKRFTQQQYPGYPFNDKNMTAEWSEGVLIGYRWNDAKYKPAAFPFGFGLSYTNFDLIDFKASCSPDNEKATVSLKVTNVGNVDDAAVPQLYVSFPSLKPVLQQLRGFKKVQVKAGGVASVEFSLGSADWSTWDEQSQAWKSAMKNGEPITVHVGTSSNNLVWNRQLPCAATTTLMQ